MIPQYSKTNNATVIQAVLINKETREEFRRQAMDFATHHVNGGEPGFRYAGTEGEYLKMTGISSQKEPEQGRWTKTESGAWRPFKNNSLYETMRRIGTPLAAIPGLPELVTHYGSEGRQWWLGPRIFMHEDHVYLGFSMLPNDEDANLKDGWGWEEILPSAYHTAFEAVFPKRAE